MIKKLLVVSLAALGIGLNGCLTDPEESTAPSITLQSIGTVTAGSGTAVTKTGKIEASDSITNVTYKIYTAAGVAVEPTKITVTGTPKNNKKSLDITVSIQAFTGAQTGDYNLRISATTDVTSEVNFPFYVEGTTIVGTPIVSDTFSAGANKNSLLGSSIDLDAGVVYKASASVSHVAELDICYAHTATNGDKLGTPNWAKASTFDFTNGWPTTVTPPATKFYKTGLTEAQFNAITTKEQIPAFNLASATSESYPTVAGDVFIVQTTANKIVLVLVQSQVPGETGKILIKYAK